MDEKQFVVFRLGSQTYGVDIGLVREIVTRQPLTRIPGAVRFVEGVINLRGRVIPVVDLARRMDLENRESDAGTHILVVEVAEETFGILVDGVSEVLRIDRERIEPAASVGEDAAHVAGVAKLEGRLVILMDLVVLFAGEEETDGQRSA